MNDRFNFLGIGISVINLDKAIAFLSSANYPVPSYICFPDAFVVSEANKNPTLKSILNGAYLTMPDGKPSQLVARLQGYKQVTTVSGFHLCNALLQSNCTHYFYGGDTELLSKLKQNIDHKYPAARVLGYKSPPFLQADEIQHSAVIAADIREINILKPNLVWIGISSPKQDYLMSAFYRQLDRSVMLGVGGVFLYLADESLKSPEWVKKAGLRWLFRLASDPVRLWRKYFSTIRFLAVNASFFINSFLGKRKAP